MSGRTVLERAELVAQILRANASKASNIFMSPVFGGGGLSPTEARALADLADVVRDLALARAGVEMP